MDAEVEKKQWDLCPFCGSEKVFGAYAKGVCERMVARGDTQEAAERYVNHSVYRECPTPEKHKEGMVPFEELENGAYYLGSCRNAGIARWNAETKQFVYMREKFGDVYPEEIGYWVEAQPGEHRFDEFKPYCKSDSPPFEIPMTSRWR